MEEDVPHMGAKDTHCLLKLHETRSGRFCRDFPTRNEDGLCRLCLK